MLFWLVLQSCFVVSFDQLHSILGFAIHSAGMQLLMLFLTLARTSWASCSWASCFGPVPTSSFPTTRYYQILPVFFCVHCLGAQWISFKRSFHKPPCAAQSLSSEQWQQMLICKVKFISWRFLSQLQWTLRYPATADYMTACGPWFIGKQAARGKCKVCTKLDADAIGPLDTFGT